MRSMMMACLMASSMAWAQQVKLSLQDALKGAIETNLDIRLEKIKVDSSTLDFESTRAVYEPSVTSLVQFQSFDARASNIFEGDPEETFTNENGDLDITLSKAEDFGFDWRVNLTNNLRDSTSGTSFGKSYGATWSVGFSQKLLRGFGFDTEVSRKDEYIARGNLAISELDLRLMASRVLQDTENAYWDLVQSIEQLRVYKNSLKLAEQLYQQNKIKIEVGTLAPIELVNAEATVATREADIVSAENAVRAAEDRLRKLMNLPPDKWMLEIVPEDEPGTSPIKTDLVGDYETAVAQRVEMRQNRIRHENALLSLKYQNNQLLPELNFSGAYFLRGASNPLIDPNTGQVVETSSYSDTVDQISGQDLPGYQVSLNLTWNPFNKAAKIAKSRAEVELTTQDLETQRLRLQVLEEVRGAIRELETAEKSIKANEKARNFAEENLRAEQQKFQNGLTTNYRVAEVQDQLAQAISKEIQARISYRKAMTAYYQAIGTLVEQHNIHLN
ncbi:MAG: TolC family protein [Acidobacteria bacterium]|nr:TolC family protein [Acidobacteriota bacterium]